MVVSSEYANEHPVQDEVKHLRNDGWPVALQLASWCKTIIMAKLGLNSVFPVDVFAGVRDLKME